MTADAIPSSSTRLHYLTCLRGIAAVSVVVQHVVELTLRGNPSVQSIPLVEEAFGGLFNFGRFGVMLFFLISGYVIPFSLNNKYRQPLVAFGISRFFRLYPAYWVSISLATLVLILVGTAPTWWQVVANLTMVQTVLGQDHLVAAYWTLMIELIFYGLCAALFWIRLSQRFAVSAVLSLGFLAIALLKTLLSPADGVPLGGVYLAISFMFLGSAIREAVHHGARLGWLPVLGALTMFLLVKVAMLSHYTAPGALKTLVPEFGADLLAVSVFLVSVYFRFPNTSFLRYLGEISYSVYLFHGVAILFAQRFAPPVGGLFDAIKFASITIVLTLVVAAIVYRFVEQPCIKLGHQLRDRVMIGWLPGFRSR